MSWPPAKLCKCAAVLIPSKFSVLPLLGCNAPKEVSSAVYVYILYIFRNKELALSDINIVITTFKLMIKKCAV